MIVEFSNLQEKVKELRSENKAVKVNKLEDGRFEIQVSGKAPSQGNSSTINDGFNREFFERPSEGTCRAVGLRAAGHVVYTGQTKNGKFMVKWR